MQSSSTRSLVLVFPYHSGRFADMVRGLGGLSAGDSTRPRTVDAYYDAASQSVGVVLHYFISNLTPALRQRVEQTCATLHVDVIEPDRATDTEIKALDRVASASARVFAQSTVSMALWGLSKAAGLAFEGAAATLAMAAPPPPNAAARRPMGSSPELMLRARPTTAPRMPLNDRATRVTPSPLAEMEEHETSQFRLASQPTAFDVRFLRGGYWVPARLRALSIKGAYVVTGALMRLDDRVHVAIAVGDQSVLVRGTVFHVTSSTDVLSTGTSGFAVRFDLDATTAPQLTQLLEYAAECEIELDPPPARGALRLPVAWPVRLRSGRVVIEAEALDVSRSGLFVQTTAALAMLEEFEFTVALDDGEPPIIARGRVVRALANPDAAQRGMRPGYGLLITEMTVRGRERWGQFLERVLKRSQKRVLVGAAHGVADEIARLLSAAGYCVVTSTDAAALMQLTDSDDRLPDIAVLDASLGSSSQRWVDSALSQRHVPRVVTRVGEAGNARSQVDRALHVN